MKRFWFENVLCYVHDEEMNKERGFGELGVVRFRVGEQKTAKEGRNRRGERES